MKQSFKVKQVKGSRIMVRVFESRDDDKTDGGIIIATAEARKEMFPYEEGVVIMTGDEDHATHYKEGDKVLISHMTPPNPINKGEEDGKTFRDWILFAADIVATVE